MSKRIQDMDYPEFMNYMCHTAHKVFDHTICEDCGGTGAVAQMCCSGAECGCDGMPHDFELECKKCGRKYKQEDVNTEHCNYCGKETESKDHDCVICGFSKTNEAMKDQMLEDLAKKVAELKGVMKEMWCELNYDGFAWNTELRARVRKLLEE